MSEPERCKAAIQDERNEMYMRFCFRRAETTCSFCSKQLCRDHAHVCNDKEVACYDCLVNLGAPV